MDYEIRPLAPQDEPILWKMLYHAVHTGAGEPPPREIVRKPELARYVEGWGRAGDRGFVAYDAADQSIIGAAWLRMPQGQHKGYGYVDDATPELAFAVAPEHRKRGIGSALLTQLVRSTPEAAALSLSV
ncbi:MAG: GNAT family N-acetyltransferase, partial [Verrucomicrobiota bacterium]|nr:GNAT family N-acetyltransferase [Verrucomicrobiota bacterium]